MRVRPSAVLAAAVIAAAVAAGCGGPPPAGRPPATEISAAAIAADIRELASDRYAGRAPGTPGDALARKYIAAQMAKAGLRPGGPDGGWEQPVPLVGMRPTLPATVEVTAGEGRHLALAIRDDLTISAGLQQPTCGTTTPGSTSRVRSSWS
jgi:hypothetical protein